MSTEWQIYTLHDPRTKVIRYVGITEQPLAMRYAAHLSNRCNGKKREWLLELFDVGLKPIMRRLALFDGTKSEAEDVEKAWMDLVTAKYGADLVNVQKKTRKRKANAGSRALAAWLSTHLYTQAEFATVLGVQQPHVSRWLLGVLPRINIALKIQQLTGIPVDVWGYS